MIINSYLFRYAIIPLNPQIEFQGHLLTHNGYICWPNLAVPSGCYYSPPLSGSTCSQPANDGITLVLDLIVRRVAPGRVICCLIEKRPYISSGTGAGYIVLHRDGSPLQSLSAVHTRSPQGSRWKYTTTHLRVPGFTNYA